MSTEESQNSDDRAKLENRGIATSTHLPGPSSIPWNIAFKTQDQAHTENSQMKLRHIAEEMRIEKTGIKWGKMMTRYLPAPPNLMHQNCRNPVYKHASISVYQRTRISVLTNKQNKQKPQIYGMYSDIKYGLPTNLEIDGLCRGLASTSAISARVSIIRDR